MIDLIPTGRKNAILLRDLAAKVGRSPRAVQSDIQALRDNGHPILSAAQGGYYLPTPDAEGIKDCLRYIAMMRRQALSRLKRIRTAKRWIRELYQMRFITNNTDQEV